MARDLFWVATCTVLLTLLAGGRGDSSQVGMADKIIDEQTAVRTLTELGEEKVSFLNKLIAQARNDDPGMLQKAIFTLKVGLYYKTVSVTDVVEGIDNLIPVLMLGLESDRVSVQVNSIWIISGKLLQGTVVQAENIFSKLKDTAIIPAITKLAQKLDDMAVLRRVAYVAYFFCVYNPDHERHYPHSLDTVWKVVYLFKILSSKTNDDQIRTHLTLTFAFLLNAEGSRKAIVSGGILPSVVENLSHSSEMARSTATYVMSKVTKTGPEMLEFFKALNGTKCMEGFYKVVQDSKFVRPYSMAGIQITEDEDNEGVLMLFFERLYDALEDGDAALKTGLKEAVLDSGFVPALVECLREEETPEMCPVLALSILTTLMREVAPQRLGTVMGAEAVPRLVDLLDSSNHGLRWLAVSGLGDLIKTGPKVRDQVIRLGGIEKLIRLLEEEGGVYKPGTLHILNCFENLLETHPGVGLDKYEKLADSLNELIRPKVEIWYAKKLDDEGAYYGMVYERVLRCVGHLIAHGKDGLEFVDRKGILNNIIDMLSFKHPKVQRMALEMLSGIGEAEKKYVPILIKKGIFHDFGLLSRFLETHEIEARYGVFVTYLMKGLVRNMTQNQIKMLRHFWSNEHSILHKCYKALKGSNDPVAAFKEKFVQVCRQLAKDQTEL